MNRMEDTTLLDHATEAVVTTHDEEMKAFLRGEYEANTWRPEEYAKAVLAALGLDDLDTAAKRMERIDPRSVPDQESWHRAMLQEALSPLATEGRSDG